MNDKCRVCGHRSCMDGCCYLDFVRQLEEAKRDG